MIPVTSGVEENMNAKFKTRLSLASFNIQTGISTSSYREYVTGGWRHVWPCTKRMGNLNRIARLLKPFDLVGLQEVDGGGSRSYHVVQTEYLAEKGGFEYWHHQVNRRFGDIALHCNGLISRIKPNCIHDYKLPGLPGRGVLMARFGKTLDESLYLCIVHLSLGRSTRMKQLAFISELIKELPYVVVMGDFNCEPNSPEFRYFVNSTKLCDPIDDIHTFPSWKPRKMLDHILVTPTLHVEHLRILDCTCSDHLPIAMEICLPDAMCFAI